MKRAGIPKTFLLFFVWLCARLRRPKTTEPAWTPDVRLPRAQLRARRSERPPTLGNEHLRRRPAEGSARSHDPERHGAERDVQQKQNGLGQ